MSERDAQAKPGQWLLIGAWFLVGAQMLALVGATMEGGVNWLAYAGNLAQLIGTNLFALTALLLAVLLHRRGRESAARYVAVGAFLVVFLFCALLIKF